MPGLTIKSFKTKVLDAEQAQKELALELCGQIAEGYAQLSLQQTLSSEASSDLLQSVTHRVNMTDEAMYVGSAIEYAPYYELGTGLFYPGGRRTPWKYEDKDGNWHMTNGQRAKPFIRPSIAEHRDEYQKIIQQTLKGE